MVLVQCGKNLNLKMILHITIKLMSGMGGEGGGEGRGGVAEGLGGVSKHMKTS